MTGGTSNIVYLYGGYTALGLESDELWQYDIGRGVEPECTKNGVGAVISYHSYHSNTVTQNCYSNIVT